MKTLLLCATICTGLMACSKNNADGLPPPVTKTIIFKIYTNPTYPPRFGDTSLVDIHLQAYLIPYPVGNRQALLWDSVFSQRRILQYPTQDQPLTFSKSFPNIQDGTEQINISFDIWKRGYGGSTNIFGGTTSTRHSLTYTVPLAL